MTLVFSFANVQLLEAGLKRDNNAQQICCLVLALLFPACGNCCLVLALLFSTSSGCYTTTVIQVLKPVLQTVTKNEIGKAMDKMEFDGFFNRSVFNIHSFY